MTREDLVKLFAHVEWADREVLEALSEAQHPPPAAVELFAHVVGAELVWLDRIERVAQSVEVWPAADLEESKKLAAAARERYRRFLVALPAERLAEQVPYSNSAGRRFETPLADILLHVALHGSYHRGQIASRLRAAGLRPAPTDYIGFVRGAPAARRGGDRVD
jgi:uncharacterized damage-inducible protein DinB